MTDASNPGTSLSHRFPVRSPKRSDAIIFAVLAITGLAIFFATVPGLSYRLFGDAFPTFPVWDSEWWFLNTGFGLLLRCVVAALAGYLFPGAFYLWGLALIAHTPVTIAIGHVAATRAGFPITSNEPGAVASYALFQTLLIVPALFVYTCSSGVGALLGYLVNRRRNL